MKIPHRHKFETLHEICVDQPPCAPDLTPYDLLLLKLSLCETYCHIKFAEGAKRQKLLRGQEKSCI